MTKFKNKTPTTAELEQLDEKSFRVLYERMFDNRLPVDPLRIKVEAEHMRRKEKRDEGPEDVGYA